MNIREALMAEHSKKQADHIARYVAINPEALDELMECFFADQYRLCQRAAWPVGKLADTNPDLLLPYLPKMLSNLEHPIHDAVIRNTVRILQSITIPEDLIGEVYDICFHYLQDPKYAVAIRVFAMTVLTNIALRFPELKEELIPIIEHHQPYGSAGFQSRARKELKRLR